MAASVGVYVRSMGPQATRETLLACARSAEAAGFDDLWLADHIAIPPDDAEGSDGRYLDALTALAYLAASTERTQTKVTFLYQQDAPSCHECGSIMVRNGSCYKCLNCGSTSGCS